MDRQARQGAGLRRPLGAEHAAASARPRSRSSASPRSTATSRPRARSSSTRARPAGQVTSARRSRAARRQVDRHGVGARRARRRTARGSRSPTAERTHPADRRHAAVLRPRGRGAALVSLAFLTGGEARGAQPAASTRRAPPGRASTPRDGWNVAVAYDAGAGGDGDGRAGPTPRRWASSSCRRAGTDARRAGARGAVRHPRHALRADGAWWCPITPERRWCSPIARRRGGAVARRERRAAAAISVVDLTSAFAALTVAGPQARETVARFCALDLRPRDAPVGAFLPGLGGPHARLRAARGRGPLLAAVGAALGRVPLDRRRRRGGDLGGGRSVGRDRRGEGTPMRDLFRKRRMWRRRRELKDCLRRRDHRRRRRTASRPPTTSHSTASRTSRSSRRATSARARPAATRRSCAPTTRRPRARASTTPASSSTRGSARSSTSTCCSASAAT